MQSVSALYLAPELNITFGYLELQVASDDLKSQLPTCRYPGRTQEGAPGAHLALPSGHERLPRKYDCGVVPSIVRNISMKALTLS